MGRTTPPRNAAHLDVRKAVGKALSDLPTELPVLVACSGGADSLALAAATAHLSRRDSRPAGAVSVDHGIQAASAQRARTVAGTLVGLGFDPVEIVHVDASSGGHGPEGDARAARYAALDAAAQRHSASAILLGHTLDDQAETVLLGLARGSGARSLSGMPERSGRYRRPLLRLTREVVRAALPAGMTPWDDPHNADPAYARSRVRHAVLPVLEAELGPGIAQALARTADLLRADADALDELATDRDDQLTVDDLAALPQAIRWRVLRRAALGAGCPATDLTAAHVAAMDGLIVDWHGQVGIDLPGGIRLSRHAGRLTFHRLPVGQ